MNKALHPLYEVTAVISNIRKKNIVFAGCGFSFGRLGRKLRNEVGIATSLLSFHSAQLTIDRYTGAMAEAILWHLLGAHPGHQL